MPFFKFENSFIYYAHVPKCGGSSVSLYMQERFGDLAFFDNQFASIDGARQWTKSSPQHVDRNTLERMIPLHFFDAMFAIVRHPVSRIVSAFYFQQEVQKAIPKNVCFSEWLAHINPRASYFEYDNHLIPMNRIVPEGATIFYLEHGLDNLIIWLDAITENTDGPRAFAKVNQRRRRGFFRNDAMSTRKIEPTSDDLKRIATLYAEDFSRFGYDLNKTSPKIPPPLISEEFIAARDADIKRMNAPLARLKRQVWRAVAKTLNS